MKNILWPKKLRKRHKRRSFGRAYDKAGTPTKFASRASGVYFVSEVILWIAELCL